MLSLTRIFLVFGPSGAGKSTFGAYLAELLCLKHIELDAEYPNPLGGFHRGLDHFALRSLWHAPCTALKARSFIAAVKNLIDYDRFSGAVVTFGSTKFVEALEIREFAKHAQVVFLYSSAENCFQSFLMRETFSALSELNSCPTSHWIEHNRAIFKVIPSVLNYSVNAFSAPGVRVELANICLSLLGGISQKESIKALGQEHHEES